LREPGCGGAGSRHDDEPSADWVVREADLVLLFRYSALTFNAPDSLRRALRDGHERYPDLVG
jgi:hydroxyacyl-ACP dehydratase HTD2-like protein with hotdog domain